MSDLEIPIIDLEHLGEGCQQSPDEELFKTIGSKLVKAFAEIGFAYVINHGVPTAVISEAFDSSKNFFSLPQEKKNSVSKKEVRTQGYNGINTEKLHSSGSHSLELRESYDILSRDGLYPDEVTPEFKPKILSLADHLLVLNKKLLKALGFGLDLEDTELFVRCHTVDMKKVGGSCMRVLHYPPVQGVLEGSEDYIRCGEHSDYGTITILMQDDMGGLQVKHRSGKWVPAVPVKEALLINVGDLLQRWTNDQLVATVHKVVVPKEELRRKCSRQSIVFFGHPDDDVMIAPLDKSNPKYEPVNSMEYLHQQFSKTYSL